MKIRLKIVGPIRYITGPQLELDIQNPTPEKILTEVAKKYVEKRGGDKEKIDELRRQLVLVVNGRRLGGDEEIKPEYADKLKVVHLVNGG